MMRRLAARGSRGSSRRTSARRSWTSLRSFRRRGSFSLRLLEPSLPEGSLRPGRGGGLAATRRQPASRDRQDRRSQGHRDSRNYDMECLRQAVEDYPDSIAEQETAFRALTRRSRATFFRLKRSLGKVSGQVGTAQAAMGTTG